MLQYDDSVLHTYIDLLYRRARWAAVRWAAAAGIVGFLFPPVGLRLMLGPTDPEVTNPVSLTRDSLLLGAIFFALGWFIALWMGAGLKHKLQAQTLLLQMRIEKNTRR